MDSKCGNQMHVCGNQMHVCGNQMHAQIVYRQLNYSLQAHIDIIP